MRKAQEDAVARTVAEKKVGDLLAADGNVGPHASIEQATTVAREVLGEFKAVEFETITKRVGDEEIALRRLVITGPWEVDPGGA